MVGCTLIWIRKGGLMVVQVIAGNLFPDKDDRYYENCREAQKLCRKFEALVA
jgi:hypothetical protein